MDHYNSTGGQAGHQMGKSAARILNGKSSILSLNEQKRLLNP